MNIHQWKGNIRRFNDAFAKHTVVREQWNKHTKANMHRFNKNNTIWNLEDKYLGLKEKAMILVGASPCLKKDVKKLKEADDNFCIVAVNSSLKYLLKHDIVPEYCVALDSDDIDIPQHLDVDTDEVTLIASTAVAPKVLDAWKGPIYFMPYYSVDKDVRIKMRRRLGKGVPGGGNSVTTAFIITTILMGSRTLIFVGCEYCFDNKKEYYADTSLAKQEKLKMLYPCVDVLGREKWTLPAHYNYTIWQEKACSDLSPPGYFIDTSFGLLGKDCTEIHIYDLSDAITIVKKAFEDRDRVNSAKSKKAKLAIIKELQGNGNKSDVHRYNLPEQRERMLQLARS
jgi:hypothetical protein